MRCWKMNGELDRRVECWKSNGELDRWVGVENGMGMLDQRVRCVVYRGYSFVAHEYVMIVRHLEHAHE